MLMTLTFSRGKKITEGVKMKMKPKRIKRTKRLKAARRTCLSLRSSTKCAGCSVRMPPSKRDK